MAKEYKVGEKYYLPVTVERIVEGEFGVTLSYTDGDEGDTALIWNAPDLLLTAEEIYASRKMADEIDHIEDMLDYGRQKYDEIAELKSRNAELEALLKEVMATRDEAIRQINELLAENSKLKAGADKLKDTLVDRTKDVQHYKEENDRLKKALEEKAENVINLLEENEKLKAERDDLASQLGKNLAEIQNLSSEVHFLKAQKEVKKPVHVFTNDGTEVEFRRYTSVQYRTDYNILVIKDGEEIVAGFIRGDRPGNLAYWWTE